MRLLGRLVLEPDARVQKLLTGQFETVLKKFEPALTAALPHLEPQDFFWRLHFWSDPWPILWRIPSAFG